jgi:hypothetical protein
MPAHPEGRGIIERCPLEASVVKQEAARLDQIDLDAETGGKTKQRPGVLGYVRLIQGEAQTTSHDIGIYQRDRLILRQSVA